MSGNKYLTPDQISLFETKLDVLTKRLQTSVKQGSFSTEEEFLAEASRAVKDFYKYLNSPFFDPRTVRSGQDASAADYNEYWNSVLDDLTVIFTELENMGLFAVDNFNEMVTNTNRLSSRVKNIQAKLDDYALFATNPDPNVLYFKETFSNLARIDVDSNLLNLTECDIRQEEGVLTLPVNPTKDSQIVPTKPIVINVISNGELGNNHESGAAWNGDLSKILDDNPDTWVEYERVVDKTSKDEDGLVLDMVINIGTIKTINSIRINPYSFGKRSTFIIDTLEVSKDGSIYRNIKDEVNQRNMSSKERSSLFNIGASSAKYTGEGVFSFTPKEAKFIHIVIKQQSPFVINTDAGQKYRYAIGIRDIGIRGYSYLSAGEIISSKLEVPREIKQVSISTNQSPDALNNLAKVSYLVSFDDGSNWHEVIPDHIDGAKSLPVNTSHPDSVQTGSPVKSLRTKVKMVRYDEEFKPGLVAYEDDVDYVSEIHPAPASEPFEISLDGAPLAGSVWVVDPAYGSRGLDDFKLRLISGTTGASDKGSLKVPFNKLPVSMKKTTTTVSGYNRYTTEPNPIGQSLNVWVGNELWTPAITPIDSYSGGTAKVFAYDTVSGVIRFGNGDNSAFPFGSDSVSMNFSQERLFPNNKKNTHASLLEYPTTFSKKRMTIKRYDEDIEALTQVQAGASSIRLGYENIVDTSSISSSMSDLGYTTQKVFQNGSSELRASTDWSIDKANGVIYIKTPLGNDVDAALSFTYSPTYTLQSEDFDFVGEEGIASKVLIRDSGWKTVEIEGEEIAAQSNAISYDLGNVAVVPDTLTISITATNPSLSSTNNPFIKEVPFQDGRMEFGKSVLNGRERVPDLTPVTNLATFNLVEDISTDTSHAVAFSNRTLFSSEVSGTPAADGEYSVTRTGANRGRITVYTEASVDSEDAGYITYFYDNPSFRSSGLYSVDYNNGRVYMQRAFPSTNDWVVSSDYQYTNYKAAYRIARLVDPSEYTVDLTNRTIIFDEGEILTRESQQRAIENENTYYVINYGRIKAGGSSLDKLKDYYSPVVRHHVLKVRMTEGN